MRRAQDAALTPALARDAYVQLLGLVWRLFRDARLVHGDLSEYNILWLHRERRAVLIDVSQAVDLDHPRALDLLREDCAHVRAFFARAGVATLTVQEHFDWITDPLVTEANRDAALDALQAVRTSTALIVVLFV